MPTTAGWWKRRAIWPSRTKRRSALGSDAYRLSSSLMATTSSSAPWRARRTMPMPPRPRIGFDAVAPVERRADEPLDVVVEDRTVDRADPARRVVPRAAGRTSTGNGDAFGAGASRGQGRKCRGRRRSGDYRWRKPRSRRIRTTCRFLRRLRRRCRRRCPGVAPAACRARGLLGCGGGGLTAGWSAPRGGL